LQSISREDLLAKINRGDHFFLFEVLPKMYWRKHHLPGAISLPPDNVLPTVESLVPDRNAEIVLYCWDDECPTSRAAGATLTEAGYTNIRDYLEGKQAWLAAGLPMTRD
jgi:rhodanese-related sulfurtransferase